MRWPTVNGRNYLFHGERSIGMIWIEKTDWRDQLRFRNGRVPGIRSTQRNVSVFRESALQDIHVDGRVIQQL